MWGRFVTGTIAALIVSVTLSAPASAQVSQADLALSVIRSPSAPGVADTITYTFTAENLGPNDATDVVLQVIHPASLTPGALPAGCTAGPDGVSCLIGPLQVRGSGTTATLAIPFTATAEGSVTVTGTVTAAEGDPGAGNHSVSDTVTVGPTATTADLSVEVARSPAAPAVGDAIAYTYTLRNAGPAAAADVTLTVSHPGSLSPGFLPAGCTMVPGSVTCAIGSLAAGGSTTRAISFAASAAEAVMVSGAVTAAQSDPVTANNSVADTATVQPAQNALGVALTLSTNPPVAGIPYTVTGAVRNRSAAPASAVVLAFALPPGIPVTKVAPGCSAVRGGVACGIGVLAPGARAERQIVMRARRITTAEFAADARSDATDTRRTGTGSRLRTVVIDRGAQGAPVLPPPRVGQTVNLYRARGRVTVRLPGRSRFTPVARSRQIPVGSVVNAQRGRVQLVTAADTAGTLYTGLFYGGGFRLGQSRATGLSVLRLALGSSRGCASLARRATAAQRKPDERGRGRRVRHLWVRAKGKFRTRGNASAATIRGTTWLTADHCAGTLTRVRVGRVAVRDLARARTVVLRAGQEYFAPLRRSRRGGRAR